MKTLVYLNEKGGIMKTTLSLHTAAGLAIRGYQVILIDTDPQANATSALGKSKDPAFYDLMVRKAAWKHCLQLVNHELYGLRGQKPAGNLYVVPSNIESRNIATTISDGLILAKRLSEVSRHIDFVIIDTSPTPSLLHQSILMAADYLLIPTQCEAYSAFEGVPESLNMANTTRQYAEAKQLHAAQLLGIVPTMYRKSTNAHQVTLDLLIQEHGDLIWNPVSQSTIYSAASLAGQLLFAYKPNNRAAKELWSIIDRIEAVAGVKHE